MMMLQKAPRKLYQYVVQELGRRIVRGDFQPGDTLPNEDTLAAELDVSRGVLREATKVLVEKGLIHLKPKIGTQVQPRRDWNLFDPDVLIWKLESGDKLSFLRDIIEVRRIIESEAAALAARRADDDEIAPIQDIYHAMEDALADADAYVDAEFIELDLRFHMAILEACHNDLLARIGHAMRQALLAGRRSDRQDHAAQLAALPSHRAIKDAIVAHDPDAARRAAEDHIHRVRDEIERRYA